jgi:hypothetical protein
MRPLTPDEQELITLVWLGLCDLYPGRSFSVEAHLVTPAPERGWIEIMVAEPGRTVDEPVARGAIRQRTLKDLSASLLRSLQARLDVPIATAA